MTQAIVTKYLPRTETKEPRVRATAYAGSCVVKYDYQDVVKTHNEAAQKLAARMGWVGAFHAFSLPKGGYVYVPVTECDEPAFVVHSVQKNSEGLTWPEWLAAATLGKDAPTKGPRLLALKRAWSHGEDPTEYAAEVSRG